MAAKYTRRLIGGLSMSAGLPFGTFFEAVPAFLHQAGFDVVAIGWLSLLQLPWIGKPLWAPLVDRTRRPARWYGSAGLAVGCALGVLAWQAPHPDVPALCVALVLLATAAATQDLVIDATFVAQARASDGGGLGGLSAVRMAAYKAGVLGGGGALVAIGAAFGWRTGFGVAAGASGVAGLWLGRVLRAATPAGGQKIAADDAGPTVDAAAFRRTLVAWLRAPGAAQVVTFIFFYKLTLCCLGPLGKPFWLRQGADAFQLGVAFGAVGLAGALAGSFGAALSLRRWPLARALVLGSGLETLTALGYLAAHLVLGPRLLWPCVLVEGLTQGLTTTLLTVLIARCCDPKQAATQFALLGAAFGAARLLGGPLASSLVASLGWTPFLALTPALSLTALAWLPALRHRLGETPPALPR